MISDLRDAWQASSFHCDELALFARNATLNETRRGLVMLSMVLLAIFASGAVLFYYFNFSEYTVYTTCLLAVLAAHVMISAQAAKDARAMYLLGTTLIMISGTAFVLLAHRAGDFNQVLFASVALLFMVAPLVPWGLREAVLVTGLIYVTFTHLDLDAALRLRDPVVAAVHHDQCRPDQSDAGGAQYRDPQGGYPRAL